MISSKSLTLRVTSIRWWVKAVAASMVSTTGLGRPFAFNAAESSPHFSAASRVSGSTRSVNQGLVSLSSQSSRDALRLPCGNEAIPFRISPIDTTLTETRALDLRRKGCNSAEGTGFVNSERTLVSTK